MNRSSKTLFTCAVLVTALLIAGKSWGQTLVDLNKAVTSEAAANNEEDSSAGILVYIKNLFNTDSVTTGDRTTLTTAGDRTGGFTVISTVGDRLPPLATWGLNTCTVSVGSWRDSDGDGIVDSEDKCPAIAKTSDNATAHDLDPDEDNLGALCDLCPGGVFRQSFIDAQVGPASDGTGDAVWYGCPKPKDCAVAPDDDEDGFADEGVITVGTFTYKCDICLGTKNTKQRDSDGDGIGDACDLCKYIARTSNPATSHTDADDGDGFGEVCDNCDDAANECQEDRDGDRVGDACDNCLDDPNGKGMGPDDNQHDSDRDGVGDACDVRVVVTIPPGVIITDKEECTDADNGGTPDSDGDGVRDECDNCPDDKGVWGMGFEGCPHCSTADGDDIRRMNFEGTDMCCKCGTGRWICNPDADLSHCPEGDKEECAEGATTLKGCERVKVGPCEEAIKKCQSDGTWAAECGTRSIEGCDDKCAMPDVQDDVVHELDPDMDGLLNFAYHIDTATGKVIVHRTVDAGRAGIQNEIAVRSDGNLCDPCPDTPPAISEHPPFRPGFKIPDLSFFGPEPTSTMPDLAGFAGIAGDITIVPTGSGGSRVLTLPSGEAVRSSLIKDVSKYLTSLDDPQGRPGKDGYDYDTNDDGKNDSCKPPATPQDICLWTRYRNPEVDKAAKVEEERGNDELAASIRSKDTDRDGIPNWCDNCPKKFNTSQGKYDCPDIPPVDAGCPSDYLKPKEPTGGEKPKRPERPTRPAKCDDLEKDLNYEREDLLDELDDLDSEDGIYAVADLLKIQVKLEALKLPAECQAPTGGLEGPAKITGLALAEVLAGTSALSPATTENMAKAAEELGKRRSVAYGGAAGAFLDMRPVTNKDSDGDGYYDFCDNCPYKENKDQADRDGDGLGDACDNCPNMANPPTVDTDGDKIADAQANADGDDYGDICDPGDDDGDGKCDTCCVSCCCQGPACLPQDCFVEEAGSQRDPDGDGRDNFKIIDGVACDACPLADNGMDADHDGTPDGCDPCPNAYDRTDPPVDADWDGIPNVCDNCMDDRNIDQTDDDGDGHGNACDTLVGPGPGPDPLPPPPFTCPEGQIASDSDGDGVMDTCSTIEGEGSVSKAECADAGGTFNPWGAEELKDRIGHYMSIKEMREVCLGRRTLEDHTTHQPIGDVVCDENGNIIGDCAKGSTKLTGEGCGCTLRGKGLTHPETLVNIFVWMLMVIVPAMLMRRSYARVKK